MPEFDQKKAYASQEEVFFDDGREIELLHFIYSLPDIDVIRGSPEKVLEAIDLFGRTKKYLMNVGEDKGKIVTDLIAEVKPKTMVELGGYVGYSAILFGAALKKSGGTKYYTLERNPEFGAVIMALVSLAGLSDIVHVEIGTSADSLARLQYLGDLSRIDLLFLDHYKPAYTTDLKLCEELGLVGTGSVLAADNVIKPGNPPYLEYVRCDVAGKRKKVKEAESNGSGANGVNGGEPDARFAARQLAQYAKRVDKEVLGRSKGNPNLRYESRLVESFEPTGVPDGIEITRCVGEES